MTLTSRNRDGRLEIVHRRRRGARLSAVLASAGLLGCLVPAARILHADPAALPGLVAGGILLLIAAFKLAAEASRRGVVVSALHVATGEVEVRAGRGPFAVTRAFGPVEVDRMLLARSGTAGCPTWDALLIPHSGAPVRLVSGEKDEPALRDAALVLAQGMNVPLDDRRWPAPPNPAGGEPPAPTRVARTHDGIRRVYVWEYRDRFRPALALAALGTAATLFALLPEVARVSFLLTLGVSALLLLIGLGIVGHAVNTLTIRRVTLRPDAVRVERHLATLPLASRLILYSELKAVLILPRGPLATVSLRTNDRSRSSALPFEDPRIAGWLQTRLQRAAHDAGRRKTPLAG